MDHKDIRRVTESVRAFMSLEIGKDLPFVLVMSDDADGLFVVANINHESIAKVLLSAAYGLGEGGSELVP